jgi:hypothetical protein
MTGDFFGGTSGRVNALKGLSYQKNKIQKAINLNYASMVFKFVVYLVREKNKRKVSPCSLKLLLVL